MYWSQYEPRFEKFIGNRSPVTSYFGGTGAITGGILNFSIGIPNELINISYLFEEWYMYGLMFGLIYDLMELDGFNINPSTARVAFIGDLTISDGGLYRCYFSTIDSVIGEEVVYFYVDRDVTIKSERTVWENNECELHDYCWCVTCTGLSKTEIINALNLNLKAGWNSMHTRVEIIETASSHTSIWTFSIGDPSHLIWRMWED
jgi:hypothetical protein